MSTTVTESVTRAYTRQSYLLGGARSQLPKNTGFRARGQTPPITTEIEAWFPEDKLPRLRNKQARELGWASS